MISFFQEHFVSLRAEFSNEIALLKSIEHRNLVKLLGYIDRGNERILITEYVPNGTLREHLDGKLQIRFVSLLFFPKIIIGFIYEIIFQVYMAWFWDSISGLK
jgi:hypothetical protein